MREGIVLDATIQRHSAQDSTEVVCLLASLNEYKVSSGIQSYEDLGLYYLGEISAGLLTPRDYIDLDKLDRRYEEQYPRLFTGDCYAVYPKREPPQPYDGITLPGPDCSQSLRLELALQAAPEGVWLALSDYNGIMDVRPGEIRLALDALGMQTIQEYALLEIRCSLSDTTGLEDAYAGRLGDLIYSGQSLGFILQEQNQGQKGFLQTCLWVLEYEGYTILSAALNVAQDLNQYQMVQTDIIQNFARKKLWAITDGAETVAAGCFDLERYGRDLLKQRGCIQALDDGAYTLDPRTQTQAPIQMQKM